MQNEPAYRIASVDHALRLAVLLQQEGPFGVTEAAARIGVARSTAHRLLAMLVYRDFAVQDADRRYAIGPVLRPAGPTVPVDHLREVARPHLRALADRTRESANLMVLHGTRVRMVSTAESDRAVRVGDREGRLLPAHLASGGRALLAGMRPDEIAALYADEDAAGVRRTEIERIVRQTRRRGFAINDGATEAGLTAVGHPVGDPERSPAVALSVAMPTARYRRQLLPEIGAALTEAAAAIERGLQP